MSRSWKSPRLRAKSASLKAVVTWCSNLLQLPCKPLPPCKPPLPLPLRLLKLPHQPMLQTRAIARRAVVEALSPEYIQLETFGAQWWEPDTQAALQARVQFGRGTRAGQISRLHTGAHAIFLSQ